MNIIQQAVNVPGSGDAACGCSFRYDIHVSQHELDELFSTILLSDSPVAQRFADTMQQYAKKVSFR